MVHSPETSDDPAACGLRERRRIQTRRELSEAALDLFEANGVHGTTVDDIARRAGTSPRTFFRYFPTKEAAVLGGPDTTIDVIRDAAAAMRAGTPVIESIESSWVQLLAHADEHPDEHQRIVRVGRLIRAEPTLLATVLREDAERIDSLVEAAADPDGLGEDPLVAHAQISTLTLLVRLSVDAWAERRETDPTASLRQTYLEIRAAVSSVATGLGR